MTVMMEMEERGGGREMRKIYDLVGKLPWTSISSPLFLLSFN